MIPPSLILLVFSTLPCSSKAKTTASITQAKAKTYGATDEVLPTPEQEFMRTIDSLGSMEVKEKVSGMEMVWDMFGADMPFGNKYDIDGRTTEGTEHPGIFFIGEETSCMKRWMKKSCNDCTPWDVDIVYQVGMPTTVMKLSRPMTCSCCCFNRPTVNVTNECDDGTLIGSIKDPYNCCDMTFTVRDKRDEPVLYAKGGCCQLGLYCPCSLGPCAEVNFGLVDATSGEGVGNLKKTIDCWSYWMGTDADSYEIDFGNVKNYEHKALIMALSVFIDFRYFSNKKEKR